MSKIVNICHLIAVVHEATVRQGIKNPRHSMNECLGYMILCDVGFFIAATNKRIRSVVINKLRSRSAPCGFAGGVAGICEASVENRKTLCTV